MSALQQFCRLNWWVGSAVGSGPDVQPADDRPAVDAQCANLEQLKSSLDLSATLAAARPIDAFKRPSIHNQEKLVNINHQIRAFEKGLRRTSAWRRLAVGGTLSVACIGSFAVSMANPCGTPTSEHDMLYDYCMSGGYTSNNPVLDQMPGPLPDWPGERPEKPPRNPGCVACGAEILWQHRDGALHYWTIRHSARRSGKDVGGTGPVGPEWRLVGTGDLNGDGNDDILWQHSGGTVHYWPMVNGQPRAGINIGATGPVGAEWRLIGTGDLNGDGTDDILWQHVDGTVHGWQIGNGNRLAGFNIGLRPIAPEWRLIGAGDLNGDGTDDLLWQHSDGTVRYWPMKNGNPRRGINIGATGPVGPDWRLIGAGNLTVRRKSVDD